MHIIKYHNKLYSAWDASAWIVAQQGTQQQKPGGPNKQARSSEGIGPIAVACGVSVTREVCAAWCAVVSGPRTALGLARVPTAVPGPSSAPVTRHVCVVSWANRCAKRTYFICIDHRP